jgi:sugar lactone lactonase YvrE
VKKSLFIFLYLLPLFVQGQIITNFAGGGTVIGDGGPATAAIVNAANGGAFDKFGNFYICEAGGHRVRKIGPSGIISRVAGTGTSGGLGDGGPATAAQLSIPTAVVVDTFGNVYISDLNNFKVRKVDAVTGFISTVVGTGVAGYGGDGIPGTAAQLQGNEQIWVDKAGNLFICDRGNWRVRKLNTSGIITTVAGGTFSGAGSGDGGPATAAGFNFIVGVAVDDTGNIFIADYNTGCIRKVNTLGIITTIAGNGSLTYIGDGIPATAAQMNPVRLTFDTAKNLVIGDKINRRVYKIDNAGIFHCIAGNGGTGLSGDGGSATAATLDFPSGVTYDPCGNLYIAETNNKRVRKVTFNPSCSPTLETKTLTLTNNSIYPNPATEELHIEHTTPNTAYTLNNLVGAAVLQGTLPHTRNTIPLRSLPPGMYILQLTDEQGRRVVKKVVKE